MLLFHCRAATSGKVFTLITSVQQAV